LDKFEGRGRRVESKGSVNNKEEREKRSQDSSGKDSKKY